MWTLTSSVPGPTVVLLAGVHGDEPCGLQAFGRIIPQLKIIRGRVIFELGNVQAIKRGERECDTNLNRMFRSDELLSFLIPFVGERRSL